MLFLPAQQSGVELAQSQRRQSSDVTQENNEISEGKILSRETEGLPGEKSTLKLKRLTHSSVVSLHIWIQDLSCEMREMEALKCHL